MSDLCLTGASGFLGRHLLTALAGGDVEGRNGPPRSLSRQGEGSGYVRGDLLDRDSLRGFVTPGSRVVHLAYGKELDNLAAARNLADAAIEAGAAKFVHVSTAVVVGHSSASVIDESTPCIPSTAYEKEKLEIELLLRETLRGRVPLRILRPVAVFGPGGKNLVSLAAHVSGSSRSRIALRMAVMGARQMNLVAIENVAAAIVHLLTAGDDGEAMIVADDQAPHNDYINVAQHLMEGMGLAPVSPPVDLSFGLSLALRLMGRRLDNPATRFSAQRLRDSGYRPVIELDHAVRQFGRWYGQAGRGGV